jgi:hypothetical protein
VGVKVNGDGDFLAQFFHKGIGGVRFADTRHILNGQEMGAQFFQLLGHAQVIFQRILGTPFVEEVAGIANRGFTNRSGLEHGVDGNPHVLDGVQGIKNPEDVDALPVRFADKLHNDVVRIGSVAHGVCTPQQHLKTDIGDTLAQLAKTLPGIFVEEAHGSIEGCAAPHLQAEEVREALCYRACSR